jgi:signal transduction histidine kinase
MIETHNQLIVNTVFDDLPSGLILYMPCKNYRRINATAKKLLGLSPDSDYSHLDNKMPQYLTPVVALLEKTTKTIARSELVLELPCREGFSTLGYNLKLINTEEGEQLKILTFSDITHVIQERMMMENIQEELSQSRRLASIGTMIAGVAHEMNNPLTGISMSMSLIRLYTERLQRLPVDERSPVVNDSISKILSELKKVARANETAARLVNDLLSYSKPGKLILEPMALQTIIVDIVNALRTNPQFAGFSITIEGESDCLVLCDRIKLEQVFYNIIKNACEAMLEKGFVQIYYSTQQDANNKQGVVVHIKDNGPGIDKTVIKRIFDPFFTTKGNSGVGLGLSICYRIVEQHGGLLSVESEKWQGSEFQLSLPVYTPPQTTENMPDDQRSIE